MFFWVQNGFAQKSTSTLELAAYFKSKRKVKDPVISVFNQAGEKIELKKLKTYGFLVKILRMVTSLVIKILTIKKFKN